MAFRLKLGGKILAALLTLSPGYAVHAQAPAAKSGDSFAFALPTGNTATLLIYLADALGEFKKQDVDVTVRDKLGTNASTYIASGQADATFFGVGVPLLVAAQGKPTTIFYGLAGGAVSAMVMGAPGKIDSFDKLKADKNCRIAGFTPGTSNWGDGQIFKKRSGLNCDLVAYHSVAAQVGAVVSGQTSALIGDFTSFASAVAEQKVVPIVNTANHEESHKYFGEDHMIAGLWGLSDNFKAKRSAVEKVVKSLDAVGAWMNGKSNEEIATILGGFENYKNLPPQILAADVGYSRAFLWLGSRKGYVTPEAWKATLKEVEEWGIPNYDSGNPVFAYDQRVNMSYYTAAIGEPK